MLQLLNRRKAEGWSCWLETHELLVMMMAITGESRRSMAQHLLDFDLIARSARRRVSTAAICFSDEPRKARFDY